MKLTETLTLVGLGGLIVYLALNKKEKPEASVIKTDGSSAADGIPKILREPEPSVESVEDLQQPEEVVESVEVTTEEIIEEQPVQEQRKPRRTGSGFSTKFVVMDNTPFPIQDLGSVGDADDPDIY